MISDSPIIGISLLRVKAIVLGPSWGGPIDRPGQRLTLLDPLALSQVRLPIQYFETEEGGKDLGVSDHGEAG